ncbi:MAG: cytochrome b [Magnetococcales bacterium]|nr:cytochrome b [Magnetococcales bacterium]
MHPTDTPRFDPVARLMHWTMAAMLVVMVGLGFYAISLTYYDPLYHRSVFWHRSLGVLSLGVWLIRISWRLTHPAPPLPDMPMWEQKSAMATHLALYLLMALLPVTGYLLSTADGRGVSVFGWFEFPALLPAAKGREEWSGTAHLVLALGFCGLVTLHLLAALKHHFIDRDGLLRRMW